MSNTNLPTQTSSVIQNDTVSSCSISKVQEKTQLSRIKCMNSLRAIQSQLKFLIETLQDFGNMPIFKRIFSQDLDLLENHLTQEIISQIDYKTTLTKLRTTFKNAFSSKIKAYTYFVEYTGIEVKHFRDTLLQHMGNVKKSVAERIHHQRHIGQTPTCEDDNSRSGNDTYADDANIRPIYDEEPMVEIEKEIDVLETMNIELEHSVAKLHKKNETLKHHYKDLYDSIKITRSKTIEQTTSLLANNAELKAQIREKVFTIAALKNDLRKLKGNSVDTKFDKTSVLGKPVIPSLRNQSVVRQPNAFNSERAQMSKQQFASQVDVNKNLSKSVTQHYLPKKMESAFAKPDHMIASSSSRNSSKNMPRFSSNDMVHNHYLDVAKKKIQERDMNSTTSVTTSARLQTTTDDSILKPRSNNQTSRSLPISKSSRVTITVVPKADHSKSSSSFSNSKKFVCSTCHKYVFNANHDACIIKLLKEVNSRAKIQSHKTRNSNKPINQKSHTQKPGRQIFTGHRFSPNMTSAVYEKTSPRSDLRWKPTGRIFKSVGLRWIPTGKLFDSCTSKVDSEPSHGSNVDIPNIHEWKETLDVSACTSINVQKEQSLDLSAGTLCNVNKENLRVWLLKKLISQKPLSTWIHR
ncbi:hypothetical protein Tco_0820668 [Tanacetum coccineum]|uniref:Uncharacterized protein n=1 Tax=Tanacetum coccineum TaxID=301880 RepID=A0ABQ5AET9_9ASTR